jgi:hypothetical protein
MNPIVRTAIKGATAVAVLKGAYKIGKLAGATEVYKSNACCTVPIEVQLSPRVSAVASPHTKGIVITVKPAANESVEESDDYEEADE